MPFTPADGMPCQLLPDGRIRVTAPVVWTGTRGDAVLIPAGTVSDLATEPRTVRSLLDNAGPVSRAFVLHDVLCDAANTWSRDVATWDRIERGNRASIRNGAGMVIAQGPRPAPPRFLGPDIDGALRLALRELDSPAPWLYWVGVRWGALFGSSGRRAGWWRTAPAVLALSLPALVIVLPAMAGAVLSRALLALATVLAWPFTRTRPALPARAARRAPLEMAGGPTGQTTAGRARLWHAAHTLQAAQQAHEAAQDRRPAPALVPSTERVDPRSLPAPCGPTSGPQQVIRARRVAARQRDEEPAPWCTSYLEPCTPGCQPAQGCTRNTPQEHTP